MNFENREVSKIGDHFRKNVYDKKCSPKFICFNEKKIEKFSDKREKLDIILVSKVI